jgi:hypothetical protein
MCEVKCQLLTSPTYAASGSGESSSAGSCTSTRLTPRASIRAAASFRWVPSGTEMTWGVRGGGEEPAGHHV